MGYVKVPEMLSPEVLKALAGNVYTNKDEPSPEDEMTDVFRDFFKEKKKQGKKEEKKVVPKHHDKDGECCCPRKVKFIFVLNNAVVIDVNAVCEENGGPQ